MFNNLLEGAVLTNRGYRINYEDLNFEQKDKLKEDLTVNIEDTFTNFTDKYFLFHNAANKYIYIPRYYGEQLIGKPNKINLKKPIDINIKFNGELKDFQLEIINEIMPKIKNNGGGIISLPCGFGKTVIGIYIACLLKVKTIILVNRTELLNQWIERINQFCFNCNIGTILQDKIDIDNKDIVIGMLQSISMKDYDKEIFKDFGLLIVDECHHISSKIFSKALYKITSKYTIGLSATPKRKDNLEYIYKWYLGDMLYVLNQKKNNDVNVCVINYFSIDKKFKETRKYNLKQKRDMFNYVMSINNLVEVNERNLLILNIVKELIKNPLRKILVLSARVEHLEQLNTLMNDYITQNNLSIKSCIFTGKNKKDEKKFAIDYGDIIFGTYSIAKEGLDIPRMNTLILSTPENDIIQSIGRIMRKFNPQCLPLIIDLTDYLPDWSRFLSKRLKTYINNNYNISTFSYFNSKLYINHNYNNCKENLIVNNLTKSINNNMKVILDYDDLLINHKLDENKQLIKPSTENLTKIQLVIQNQEINKNQKIIDEFNNLSLSSINNIFSKY